MRRFFDHDPLLGVTEYFHCDETTGRWAIEAVQDATPILDRNKALANADDGGWSPSREWRRAASIPAVVVLKWLNEDGINLFDRNHWPAVLRKLNDPDWRWLRTAPGRL